MEDDSDSTVASMTVADLRQELANRGADTKGLKKDLQKRLLELQQADESESVTGTTETPTGEGAEEEEPAEVEATETVETATEEAAKDEDEATPASVKRSAEEAGNTDDEPAKKKAKTETDSNEPLVLSKENSQIKEWLQSMEPKDLLAFCTELMVKYPHIQQDVKEKLQRNPKLCKLFIRGLNWDTKTETLKEEFAKYGTVADVTIVMDKQMGRSKGYGFITFENADEAQKALREPKRTIDGRTTWINLASDRTQQRAYQASRTAPGYGPAPAGRWGGGGGGWGSRGRGAWGSGGRGFGGYWPGGGRPSGWY